MKPPLDYDIEPYLEWILNCQTGNISEIKAMLENGYDINTEDESGLNGLYHSLDNDEETTSLFLIENGIRYSQIELNLACTKELDKIVAVLEEKVIDTQRIGMINEAFYSLSLLSSFEFIKWFVETFHPDLDYSGEHDLTPISNVATMGDFTKFNFLLTKGADINKKGRNNLNTLEWCYEVQDNPGVNRIIEKINELNLLGA